jgi:short-subunit dehydrogenase
MDPSSDARRLCLITGASAGIGAAFARLYADRGYDLALTARRGDRLEALAEEIELRSGAEILRIEADLAEKDATDRILGEIEANGRTVSALVNNAGYGLAGPFASTPWPDQAAQLQVMLVAVCEMTQKVLPQMQAQHFGRIVNVASVAGLMPGSMGDTLYGPIKAFLIKFSQGLHLENRETGVHVTALCPGYTHSEFHDVNHSREKLAQSLPAWMWMGADEVAAAGHEAAEANRAVCVPGAPYKAITALAKVVPDEWALHLMSRDLGFIRN